MSRLRIVHQNNASYTVVSNLFIDQYMTEANEAQIKVYLYLTRVLFGGISVTVSDIADKFNHTEREVLRSLKYWEQKGLLQLSFDSDKNLDGIILLDICSNNSNESAMEQEQELKDCSITPAQTAASTISEIRTMKAVPSIPEKPSYSLDDLKLFKENEEAQQLLFIIEQYISKPLSVNDVKSIMYMNNELNFNTDLIDYLVQFCVEQNKREFRYIEKVALSWYEAGIKTAKEAMGYSSIYDKFSYSVMQALGRTGTPTSKELDYIRKWKNEMDFTNEIILEACQRGVNAVDKHRFEYTDGILNNWNKNHVHYIADIIKLEESFRSEKANTKPTYNANSNKFNNFKQNNYDFTQLEREILSN